MVDEPLLEEIQTPALVDQDVVPAGLELTPNLGMVLEESDRDDSVMADASTTITPTRARGG